LPDFINLQERETKVKDRLLKEKENLFQLIVEAMPNAIILANSNGSITFINKHTEKLFGYTKEELNGKNISVLLPQRFRENHPIMVKHFMSKPEARPMGAGRDLFAVKKDGTVFPIEIGLSPINLDEEKFALASIIDITVRKTLEDRETLHIKAIEAKNKELEQFAYIASHDLREPLQSISSFIQLIASDYSDNIDEIGQESIKYIMEAITRMKNLVQGLLDYSRLGKEAELTELDCNKIVEDVLTDLSFSIIESKAEFDIGILPVLYGFDVELRLLFQNLIGNAIKFRKKNTIPQITISAEKTKHEWTFKISDNGIGIHPDYFHKIFTIFQRLHRREEYKGTGIGLAHCRKIVDLHHGDIWVESEPDKGSTFYFTIPIRKEKV
jgi:PAS domain S-box-containing protein